jgi:hypothetical protein
LPFEIEFKDVVHFPSVTRRAPSGSTGLLKFKKTGPRKSRAGSVEADEPP